MPAKFVGLIKNSKLELKMEISGDTLVDVLRARAIRQPNRRAYSFLPKGEVEEARSHLRGVGPAGASDRRLVEFGFGDRRPCAAVEFFGAGVCVCRLRMSLSRSSCSACLPA